MHPFRLGILAGACAVALVACGGSGSSPRSAPDRRSSTATAARVTTTAPAPALHVASAAFSLPRGSARAALVADGDQLLLAGGLDGARTTTGEVLRIDPAAGTVAAAGTLPVPVHDTAGAVVGGVPTVFGGGNATESAAVQRLTPTPQQVARLPIPRSDLTATAVGGRTYLVGGYDGSRVRATTVATTDGQRFTPLGDLPTPVRYPAVAALGDRVYALGGTTTGNATGAVRAVQVLDPTTGTVTAVGDLPVSVTDAVAVALGGRLYLVGGIVDGKLSAAVWRVDLPGAGTGAVRLVPAGTLPTPTADAAIAVLHGRAFLVGGEQPDLLSAIVTLEVR